MSYPELPGDLAPLAETIDRFDHVAFAVHDLVPMAAFFGMLGGTFLRGGNTRRAGFRWIQFVLPGDTKVEAIAPVTQDCFLDSRGEGIHHLTFRVSDVAEAARRAQEHGLRVVGLFTELNSWKECFIHPSTAYGTVIQLAQWIDKDKPPLTLEAVLAGEIYSLG